MTTIKIKTMKSQAGMTLIELMIAMVIGLVILGGAVTIFSTNNRSSTMTSGMSRVQESGRAAIDILSNAVRMARYEGCRSQIKGQVNMLAQNGPTVSFPATGITGHNGNANVWTPNIAGDLDSLVNPVNLIAPNTDVLYLQHGSGRSTNLQADMASANDATIVLANNPDQIAVNDLVMISDCGIADVFRTSAVVTAADNSTTLTFATPPNTQGNLSEQYVGSGPMANSPLRVMRFESQAYFVGPTNRNLPNNTPVLSLFSLDTATDPIANPVELIEGVENLQVMYGERQANDQIRYISADNVANWSNVISAQIGLLIATTNLASSDPDTRTYQIAGTTIGPPGAATDLNHAGDRRLRMEFNTTVQLRNP